VRIDLFDPQSACTEAVLINYSDEVNVGQVTVLHPAMSP
jgi:hypothetical protein